MISCRFPFRQLFIFSQTVPTQLKNVWNNDIITQIAFIERRPTVLNEKKKIYICFRKHTALSRGNLSSVLCDAAAAEL